MCVCRRTCSCCVKENNLPPLIDIMTQDDGVSAAAVHHAVVDHAVSHCTDVLAGGSTVEVDPAMEIGAR